MERKKINRLFLISCLTFFVLAGCGRTAEREQATPARADQPPILVQPPALPGPTFATTATPTAVSTPAASPKPELLPEPGANLLSNPTCDGHHNYIPDDWTSVPSEEMWWTVSWKESNPPFEADSTACRWAQTSTRNFEFDPSGHDGYLYQVVAATQELITLEFSGWWTSNHLIRFAVLVDGAESPDGPWTPVWVAFESTTSTKRNWVEIPLRSVALDQGWPYYRFGVFCSYEGRQSGCKVTLLHFGVR